MELEVDGEYDFDAEREVYSTAWIHNIDLRGDVSKYPTLVDILEEQLDIEDLEDAIEEELNGLIRWMDDT